MTEQKASTELIEYTPLGAVSTVKLSVGIVRKFLTVPTKSGKSPSDEEIIKFMMLCRARELDPWVGDAYLVGYDSKDGPSFSLITAVQSLLKRAEANENYDGMECGVIISHQDMPPEYREGEIVFPGETLVGGWAKCYRKDKSHPDYVTLKLDAYNKGFGRWKFDPGGMIVKCAVAAALRKAFPTQTGGLYTSDEMPPHTRPRTPVQSNVESHIAQAEAIERESESTETNEAPIPDYLQEIEEVATPEDLDVILREAAKVLSESEMVNVLQAATEKRGELGE